MAITNKSERISKVILESFLPLGQKLVHRDEQSHGEHDFDILNDKEDLIGIVEVTVAMHQPSIESHIWQEARGQITCSNLTCLWLLCAHNPNPKWLQSQGAKHLEVLEANDVLEFSFQTLTSPVQEVKEAAQALLSEDIDNGAAYPSDDLGAISILASRGESSDPYVISHEAVTDVVFTELTKADNTRKLSAVAGNPELARHFFVEIDLHTQPAAGSSMRDCMPPNEPPNLEGRATVVWVVLDETSEFIVWRGDQTGWIRSIVSKSSDIS
ncbi:hypothetical protein [Ruegeria arenilitoris]|uniref:hypothetical protein n=1 Tax=Ruegeria arenilitoris TaxID=1173585 RepID=UPI00147B5D28|nr:hypothetical protein [Ruegeria arenilitoris]